MINHKFDLDKSFQETLYRIDNWINESFGWIVESTKFQYINISTHRLLSGGSYIKLPAELKSLKKANQHQKQRPKSHIICTSF